MDVTSICKNHANPSRERTDAVMKNNARFFFKSCARCGGDMVQDRDLDGYFRKCLQCGRIVELGTAIEPLPETAERKLAA